MNSKIILSSGAAVLLVTMALGSLTRADTTVGASGKTFASSAVQCVQNPNVIDPSVYLPVKDAVY